MYDLGSDPVPSLKSILYDQKEQEELRNYTQCYHDTLPCHVSGVKRELLSKVLLGTPKQGFECLHF